MMRKLKALGITLLSLFYDVRITRRGKVYINLRPHNRG